MKSFTLTFVLAVIATLSFAQFPQSKVPDSCCFVSHDLRAAVHHTNNNLVSVKVAKHLGDKVKIKVKENNKLLYTKSYKHFEHIDVQYDITRFPNGKYTFEITQNNIVIFSKVINHQTEIDQIAQR